MAPSRPTIRSDSDGNIAFILTVIGAFTALLLSGQTFTLPEWAALLLLGIIFTLVGVTGIGYVACRSLLSRLLFFAAEISIGAAIIYLSHASGFMGFLLLPIASHAVFLLSRRWMLALCILLVLISASIYGLLAGWNAFVQSGIGYAVATVFVVIFTQVAVNEHRARAEVERLAQELADANQQLREYAAQVEELATMRERNRLAREIHDSLGHSLTTINIQLEAARAIVESDRPRAMEALRQAQMLTREGLAEVRRSVAALRDSPLHGHPLPEAIDLLAEDCRAAGILTEYSILGTPRPLSPQTELTLYRVAQEGLTNTRRHSHASRAELVLDYRDSKTVCFRLSDNGVGANVTNGGFGLLGIRERVQLLDGTVKTSSEPGKGFRLETVVPG